MDPTTASSPSTSQALDAVRVRRAELRDSLSATERALAAPAGNRAVVWGEAVHTTLAALAGDFAAHSDVTERPGGLYESIVAGDLRLTNAVDALTAEHASIADEIATVVADSAAPVSPGDVPDLRERTTRLLGHLIRHRQRGADLIYEAYETDIGGND